ncbi:MAG: hypothetical protein H0T62_06740 [Parachlamydiaceae bacterium]|nr:hypothetical protein [Parachlamydiaceae bacterium]
MQIQEFPKWFKEIEKKLLTDQVNNVFSKLELKVSLLTEIITFFGVINKNKIKSTLESRGSIKYENEYMRLEQVLSIYIKCIKKNNVNEISPTIINEVIALFERAKLYEHLPTYSDIWTYAIKDMSKYILAWSMPLQDSQLKGCYPINWIKLNVDSDEVKYQKLIMTLFQIKSNENQTLFSDGDELLLYKRPAIKAYGKEISWASYLYKWLEKKDSSNPLHDLMASSALFKIFIKKNSLNIHKNNISNKDNTKKISCNREKETLETISNVSVHKTLPKIHSFKYDLFIDTIHNLYKHPKSLLPKSTYFKETLLKLFETTIPMDRSDCARQSIMYYIDYLEQNYGQMQLESTSGLAAVDGFSAVDRFPHANDEVYDFKPIYTETFFKNGLDFLNVLIPQTKISIYNFLHALLHYFNCLNQSTDNDAKDFLFKSIYFMQLTDRKKYDIQIKELPKPRKFSRSKFKIDSSLIKFANSHTLTSKQWGALFLRFSRSNLQGEPCPYMDPEAHLNLVVEIEKLTGLLSDDIVFDLLYFQMACGSASIFKVLTEFSDLRNLIIKSHLEEISLPSELYEYLEKLPSNFIEQFTNTLPEDICKLNPRSYSLASTIMEVAFLLSFTTYPKTTVLFSELIPEKTQGKKLIFSENVDNQIINNQRPLHPVYHYGPTWLVRWEFNERLEMFEMIVILTNRIKSNVSCSFRLPIKIPTQNVYKSIHFCNLMSSVVDGLGKEALSEDENLKAVKLGLTVKARSTKNSIHGTPQKKFDQFMEFSPLLKYEFEKINQKKEEESQQEEIKAELFEFVTLLRTSFLQSFYFVLNPEKMSTKLSNTSINAILPRPDGFYFSSALSLFIPELKETHLSEVHIKNSDYLVKFREIYLQLYWDDNKTPRLYQDAFILYFYAEESIQEFPISLQIENLYIDQSITQSPDIFSESSEKTSKHSKINVKKEEFLQEEGKIDFKDENPPDASNNESKTSQEETPSILQGNILDLKSSDKGLVPIANNDEGIPEDIPVKLDKIVQITLKLQANPNDQKLYTLTIKRSLFDDEKDFKDFMLWQIAIACSDNKDAWLWKF